MIDIYTRRPLTTVHHRWKGHQCFLQDKEISVQKINTPDNQQSCNTFLSKYLPSHHPTPRESGQNLITPFRMVWKMTQVHKSKDHVPQHMCDSTYCTLSYKGEDSRKYPKWLTYLKYIRPANWAKREAFHQDIKTLAITWTHCDLKQWTSSILPQSTEQQTYSLVIMIQKSKSSHNWTFYDEVVSGICNTFFS